MTTLNGFLVVAAFAVPLSVVRHYLPPAKDITSWCGLARSFVDKSVCDLVMGAVIGAVAIKCGWF